MKNILKRTIAIVILVFVITIGFDFENVFAGVRPSVSVSAPSKNSIEKGESVSYTITFSNTTKISLSEDYINMNGFTASVKVTGSGEVRTITLSNVQGSVGNKNISIKAGAAENYNGASLATPNSISFALNEKSEPADAVRPSISISAPDSNSINVGGTVRYVVTFADNVGIAKINLSESYINMNGFTANVSVTGTENSRTIVLSNVQGTAGSKNISIKSGAAEDAAGNKTLATPNSISFTLNESVKEEDKVRPSISISEPSLKQIYMGETVSYVVTFADNKGIAKVNLSNDYIVLNGFTASVKITESGNTRTITLSNVQGDVGKNCNITIKSGAAEDAAGNKTLQTPNSISFQIIEKNTSTTPVNEPTESGKLDNEPNTGVEGLPVLQIMSSAVAILSITGVIITKKIYG